MLSGIRCSARCGAARRVIASPARWVGPFITASRVEAGGESCVSPTSEDGGNGDGLSTGNRLDLSAVDVERPQYYLSTTSVQVSMIRPRLTLSNWLVRSCETP
jgi:hypothetical protein